ncbi:MAG: MFS transporter [Spirochaetes bacterium]|nr:MFS transporter [Spirochaetota bacterium]MBU0955083.1 MFS transporter [Spirochaetota bacterium]
MPEKAKTELLPREIYALFVVRLVVSAGAFVGPFLAMMLTMKMGYNDASAGVFMAFLSVLSALGLAVGGKLGDSFNRAATLRTLQFASAAIFALCALLGFNRFTPFVIAAGMATLSGTWPVINALVADLAPENRRKEAFSLLYWGNNIGFSVGPLIAGFLFNSAPRLLFLGNAVAIAVAGLVVSFFVYRPKTIDQADSPKPETPPQLVNLNSTATESNLAAKDLSTLAILLKNPILLMYGLSSILVAFVYNQHTFALPIFLKDALGAEAGPKAYGFVMTANGLTVVALTAVVVLFSRRLPSLAAVALASVFYAVGFGAYAFVGGLGLALGATVIWTIGEILGATNGNAFIAERAPPAYRSRINSAISLAYIAGNAAAPLVAGPVSRAYGSHAVWPMIALLSLLSAAITLAIHLIDKRGRKRLEGVTLA